MRAGSVAFSLLVTIALLVFGDTIPFIDPHFGWIAVGLALVVAAIVFVSAATMLNHSRPPNALKIAAEQKGIPFHETLDCTDLPGRLFRVGSNIETFSVVDAREMATPFVAGNLIGQYVDDSGNSPRIASAFIAIPTTRSVPNIVLLRDDVGLLRRAGLSLNGRQRLDLEGEFGQNFSLYSPVGSEREALYIFAPDLMRTLIDTASGCDVELVDGWMFVYSNPGRYQNEGALDRIIRTVERVHDKLGRLRAI